MCAVYRPRLGHRAKAISSLQHLRVCAPFEPMALVAAALRRAPGLVSVALLLAASAGWAQELEPRAYSPNPIGANYVLLAYGRTTGDVLVDPSLPLTDVQARANSVTALYGRTFGLFGRSASIGCGVPWLWGTVEGEVFEEYRSVRRSGLGDCRLRLSLNLLGGPALAPAAFAKRRPCTTLGASLVVSVPTGQYDPAKLINLGANRWAVKSELGLSMPAGAWVFEASAGVWLFTDNPDFFGGSVREQAPLGSFQAHVGYTFRPRLWLAADATYYTGGRTTVGGQLNADYQKNSRAGLTLAVPFRRSQSVKLSWATGATTRIGGDFDTLALAWQYLWF